jgi:hypothetical protein
VRVIAYVELEVVGLEQRVSKGERDLCGTQPEVKDESDQKSGLTARESSIMGAETILTGIAILLLAATFWNYLQSENRLTPARRTWLSIAAIFALVSILLRLFRR